MLVPELYHSNLEDTGGQVLLHRFCTQHLSSLFLFSMFARVSSFLRRPQKRRPQSPTSLGALDSSQQPPPGDLPEMCPKCVALHFFKWWQNIYNLNVEASFARASGSQICFSEGPCRIASKGPLVLANYAVSLQIQKFLHSLPSSSQSSLFFLPHLLS